MLVDKKRAKDRGLGATTFQDREEEGDPAKDTEKEQPVSDPVMAESPSKVSSNLDILEANDEVSGKKKSKFKAFKSFFVKKKKKETETAQRRRMLKPSLSSSNIDISFLDPVQEGEPTDPRNKSGMGNKALSHESIFMLDTEPEISASEIYTSTEFQRGRTLRRPLAFKTLPRSGAVSGNLPRSGVWVAGSKITEIPPLRPRQPSLSPPLIRSDAISKDLEDISIDDESPKSQQRKASSNVILTAKKSLSGPSFGPNHSQSSTACALPSGTQQLTGFSTPATRQSCLDSLAALHKITLNPWKQPKKNLQVEDEQKEQNTPVVSEGEKSTTEPNEADLKKVKIESTGHSGQEQSDNSEIYDQKTTDKSTNTSAAGNPSNPVSAEHGQRRKRIGTCVSLTNEYGSKGKSFIQSSQKHGLGDGPESSSTKTASDGPSWYLLLEKQALEQLTTSEAEITVSQELPSDTSDMRRNATVYFEVPQSVPEDMKESMVSGPPPNLEDGASAGKKTESRTSLLPVVRRPSTTPKEAIFLITTEAQVLRDPSPIQSEEASSLGLQDIYSKTENVPTVCKEKAENGPTVCKEEPPGNVLQACTVSISNMTSTTEEGGISMEKPETAKVSPDSKSAPEKESGSEKQLAAGHSFQCLKKPKDEQKFFQESENVVVELNSVEQQLALGYSSQFLREPEAEKGSSKSESNDDTGSSSKEVSPGPSSQSLGKQEVVSSESESSDVEQLAPPSPSQAILKPEDKDISPGSNGYVKKHNGAEDWKSSEEGLPLRCPNQALEKPEDQQEVPSVPENAWEVQMPSKRPVQSIVRPIVQPHVSSSSVSICLGQHGSEEPVTSGHPFQPWVHPKFVQVVPADEESAVEWGSLTEPLMHGMISEYLMNPKAEQKSSSGPVTTSMEEVSMEMLPPRYSQPLTRPTVEEEASEYPESTSAEQRIYMALGHPSCSFQQWVSPQVEHQVFSSPERPAVEEGGLFADQLPPGHLPQPLMNCIVQQSMTGSEGVAAEVISAEPRYSKYSLPSPQVQPLYSESTAEQGIFVEQLPLGCHCQPLVMPRFQPQVSLESASTSAPWPNAGELVPVRHTCRMWMSPECKQQGSVSPQSIEAEWGVSKESVSPRDPGQPGLRPTFEQVSAGPETTPEWSFSVDPPLPRMPSQRLERSVVVKQPVSTGSVSTCGQWNSSMEPGPPGHPFQSWVSSTLQQQVPVDLESTETEGSISMDLEPSICYSQPLMRPVIKQEISSSTSTSEEWGGPLGPVSSRHTFLPWANPKFEQQFSAGPESVAMQGDIPGELPRHLPQATMRQKVQTMFSSLESATVEGGISEEESLSPTHPTCFLARSKVQEMPSTLESAAAEESISKKLRLLKSPSHSFVKFMAQQIFSDSSGTERGIYADPPSPSLPSKSLLRPEVEHQIFSGWENPDIAESISLKHALKSLGRPADPQESLSFSERAPMKQSSSKWQVPSRQPPGKLRYQQEISSVSSEEWRSYEEQLPSRHPSEALHGFKFLPPAGSVNVPVQWSNLGEHQPPRHFPRAFGNAEYQQQVYPSAMSAAADVTIFENNSGSWSLPKGPVSPKKTKKHSQGSEDFTKSISTSAPKPGKFIIAPTWKIPFSRDTYYKGEILRSGDRSNDDHSHLLTSEADVENLPGIQQKIMSSPQSYKNERPDSFTQLPSLPLGPMSSSRGREQQMRRGASQGFLDTTDSLTTPPTLVEKYQSRATYEGVAKKQPTYKTPVESFSSPGQRGKPLRQSDYYVSDPAWFTMARQKHKGSQVYTPVKETKTKSRAGSKTETKEYRHGTRPEAAQKTPQKGGGPANDNQPKKILTSSIHKQEKKAQLKSSKSIKSVVFEDQKMPRTTGTGKEMNRSLSLPSGLQYLDEPVKPRAPVEPVWFSMAKKKAKAWSHIAQVMQ